MNEVEDMNGDPFPDVLSLPFLDLKGFVINKIGRQHVISDNTAQQIDLISFLMYGDHQYWWLLMILNSIQDMFTELTTGKTIAIPQQSDIEAFYQNIRSSAQKGTVVVID